MDELTSVTGGPEAPAPETGAQAYDGSQAPQYGTDASGQGGAGETPAGSTGQTPEGQQPPKVNLFEHPDFQRYQAAQERQQAMLRQQVEQQNQRLRELQMAGMDDFQRAQYEAQEANQRAAGLQQQLEYQQAMQYRAQELGRIAQTTGAPVEALEQAESPAHAWEIAVNYNRQQGARNQARASEANKPYLPQQGGSNTDPFEEARRNRDPVAWIRAVRRGG